MRCVFDNEVLNVIERTRMQAKNEWGVAGPAAAGSSPSHERDTSRRSTPAGWTQPGLHTPLISPGERTESTPSTPGSKRQWLKSSE